MATTRNLLSNINIAVDFHLQLGGITQFDFKTSLNIMMEIRLI